MINGWSFCKQVVNLMLHWIIELAPYVATLTKHKGSHSILLRTSIIMPYMASLVPNAILNSFTNCILGVLVHPLLKLPTYIMRCFSRVLYVASSTNNPRPWQWWVFIINILFKCFEIAHKNSKALYTNVWALYLLLLGTCNCWARKQVSL
jgi:hypothetical protein